MRFEEIGTKVLEILENTNDSIFITGKAGTWKSTLIKHWIDTTDKKIAVLAPTGLAALNIGGSTIHKFFGRWISVTRTKVWVCQNVWVIDSLDAIIIDEISMVRADLLDCISVCLQQTLWNSFPFGWLQMVFVGDMFQLPPIVPKILKDAFGWKMYASELFISSTHLQALDPKFVELSKVYRQEDESFKTILNNVREGKPSISDLEVLNAQHSTVDDVLDEELPAIIVAPTNTIVQEINDRMFYKLNTAEQMFFGTARWVEDNDLPVPQNLRLKIWARVMAVANIDWDEWSFVNGDLWFVVDLWHDYATVKFDNGKKIIVTYHEWEMKLPTYNEQIKDIEYHAKWKYSQIPLKLAWAVTIHKSQGLTFDKIAIYQTYHARVFSPGQMYVALSRVRTLQWLRIIWGIKEKDIVVDKRILAAYNILKCNTINIEEPILKEKRKQKDLGLRVGNLTMTRSRNDT